MQDTENAMIHIGKPIELDEDVFFKQLHELKQATERESGDIKGMIRDIVPTYVFEERNGKSGR